MFRIPSLLACSLLGLVACSDDGNTTTGKRIVLHNSVAGDASIKNTFTTGFGYDVTLTKAAIATNGFYYFDGPPPTAMYVPKSESWGERFAGLFIGTAHAHPGHYESGTALGQVALGAPLTIDLFGALPLALPDGEGITGTYRSGRFTIAPSGPGDAVLGTHVAIAEGKATKNADGGATTYFFRLIADYADVSASITNGAVDGCVLDETVVSDTGSISLAIAAKVWLNLVEFSSHAPGTEAAPTETKDSGFSQGVTQLSAYRFTYTKP